MGLLRSGSLVAGLILLGRLTGFGREWLLAARAGASSSSDLAIVLLTLPDLLVNLLLGGGLGATLVPALQQLVPGQRQRLATQVALLIGLVFVLVAVVLGQGAPQLLALMAPGVAGAERTTGQGPLMVALVALPLTALAGVTTALLNACGRFGLGACGTALFNLLVMAALASQIPVVWAVAWGVIAGSLLRLLVQMLGAGWRRLDTWRNPWLIDRPLMRRFGGNFGFITALVLMAPITRSWASSADTGALSLFNYASKIVELPLGVLMGALSTVLLPHLASNPSPAVVGRALRLSTLVAIAITVPAVMWATPLARIVYFRADFSAPQLQQLGQATALSFAFLLPQALVHLYGTIFAALGQTKPLAITAVVMVTSLVTTAPLAVNTMGLNGAIACYGLSYFLGAALLSFIAFRSLGREPFLAALRPGKPNTLKKQY